MSLAASVRRWLRKRSKRVVIVEVDYMYQVGLGGGAVPTLGTLYFSNRKYIDEDVPRSYIDALIDSPRYSRSLNRDTLTGAYDVSISSLKFDDSDKRVSYLLDLPIDGSEVRVYVGEADWARSDFIHL